MGAKHQEDLANFLGELQAETDRGLPLVAAALIDEKLLETLQAFLCHGPAASRMLTERNAPLATFSSRADACLALGLIEDGEYAEISLIRKVRNEFAHARHGLSFADQRIEGLCGSLTVSLPTANGVKISGRTRFIHATLDIVLRLLYRPQWVARERRQTRRWIDPDEMRWRTMDEPIPPGRTVVFRSNAGLRLGELPTTSPADSGSPIKED